MCSYRRRLAHLREQENEQYGVDWIMRKLQFGNMEGRRQVIRDNLGEVINVYI